MDLVVWAAHIVICSDSPQNWTAQGLRVTFVANAGGDAYLDYFNRYGDDFVFFERFP